jgi:hypothetical protein
VKTVRMTNAHFRTVAAGVRQTSIATKRNDGTVRIHHKSITPPSTTGRYRDAGTEAHEGKGSTALMEVHRQISCGQFGARCGASPSRRKPLWTDGY